jgi:hypothetical protein
MLSVSGVLPPGPSGGLYANLLTGRTNLHPLVAVGLKTVVLCVSSPSGSNH